jgi:hypothetical protein
VRKVSIAIQSAATGFAIAILNSCISWLGPGLQSTSAGGARHKHGQRAKVLLIADTYWRACDLGSPAFANQVLGLYVQHYAQLIFVCRSTRAAACAAPVITMAQSWSCQVDEPAQEAFALGIALMTYVVFSLCSAVLCSTLPPAALCLFSLSGFI